MKLEVKVKSKRGTEIPCSVVVNENGKNMPLVMMAHGFCATRDENGTFPMLADKILKENICSIRCDFPGCHDSEESMLQYTIDNCMDDLDSIYEYMVEHYLIDTNHVAVVGYSMGGRVTLHYIKRHPELKTIALWAPAAVNSFEGMAGSFGDKELVKEMLEVSEKQGYYPYDNIFDNTIKTLSFDFFDQMNRSKARDFFHEYKGNCVMVYGNQDITVPHELLSVVSTEANKEANFLCHVVDGADHGFGAWTNQPEQMVELTDVTADFIIKNI